MPLPEALRGDKWTQVVARKVLPLLVWYAQCGQTITYGQLDQEIVRRGWWSSVALQAYGHPAGAIGNALLETGHKWGERIPLLNALIINKEGQLPSDGVDSFLKRYYHFEHEITPEEKLAVVEDIHGEIFLYNKWDRLLKEYGMDPIDDCLSSETDNFALTDTTHGGWSTEHESKEHRLLKEHIAKNPHAVGLAKNPKNSIEYVFASGDVADIVFEWNTRVCAVEIKSIKSNHCDIYRGIFQCIKYKALLRAEQKLAPRRKIIQTMLVCEEPLNAALKKLAKVLNVNVVVYPFNKI